RLADKLAFALGGLGDGFAISNLRRARIGLHLELAKQAVPDDFQVQFTHARDDELAGFFIGETAKRRVLLRQALQTFPHLVTISLRLRFDRHADDRLGERRRFEHDIKILVAQRVASPDVAQADERGDVARENLVHVLALAALNDHQPADTLAFARTRIVNRFAFLERARINAE